MWRARLTVAPPSQQRVYYMSMEYYMGRSLSNAMVNLGIESECEEALYEVCVRACVCVCVHACVCVCVCVCMHVCMCACVCACVCMYTCACMCVYTGYLQCSTSLLHACCVILQLL